MKYLVNKMACYAKKNYNHSHDQTLTSCQVYLKLRVDWPQVSDEMLYHNRSKVHNSQNLYLDIDRKIYFKIIKRNATVKT